eukprot:1942007-Amphidinium_carterae.1
MARKSLTKKFLDCKLPSLSMLGSYSLRCGACMCAWQNFSSSSVLQCRNKSRSMKVVVEVVVVVVVAVAAEEEVKKKA